MTLNDRIARLHRMVEEWKARGNACQHLTIDVLYTSGDSDADETLTTHVNASREEHPKLCDAILGLLKRASYEITRSTMIEDVNPQGAYDALDEAEDIVSEIERALLGEED